VGCYLKREGAAHSLCINPPTGVVEAVPRHSEVKEPLAKRMLRNLGGEYYGPTIKGVLLQSEAEPATYTLGKGRL